MKATVNSEAGVKALTDMVEQNKCQPPGVQNWGFGESLSALNSGEIAMTITWPPVARWAQGINADEQALSWVPPTQVKDKIGYAISPSGHSEMAAGILLAVSPNSKNKDATYLYIQWLHSQQESLKNVMRPLGLRDPFRISHYESPEFQALWPTAKDYLETHKNGGRDRLRRSRDPRDLQVLGFGGPRGECRDRRQGPEAGARRSRGRVGPAHGADRGRPPARGLHRLGGHARGVPRAIGGPSAAAQVRRRHLPPSPARALSGDSCRAVAAGSSARACAGGLRQHGDAGGGGHHGGADDPDRRRVGAAVSSIC